MKSELAGLADSIAKRLIEEGFTVQRYNAYTTNSIYLKLDYGVCNSIRISDHPGKKHLKYRYNIGTFVTGYREEKDRYPRLYYQAGKTRNLVRRILRDREDKLARYGPDGYRRLMQKNRQDKENAPLLTANQSGTKEKCTYIHYRGWGKDGQVDFVFCSREECAYNRDRMCGKESISRTTSGESRHGEMVSDPACADYKCMERKYQVEKKLDDRWLKEAAMREFLDAHIRIQGMQKEKNVFCEGISMIGPDSMIAFREGVAEAAALVGAELKEEYWQDTEEHHFEYPWRYSFTYGGVEFYMLSEERMVPDNDDTD